MQILDTIYCTLNNPTYSIVLTHSEIEYIHFLLSNSPELFHKIGQDIEMIISDRKIDYHDIPLIILLISKIYHTGIIHTNINNIEIINIIKFIVDSILQSDYIPLPHLERYIIQQLVDSSLELLKFNLSAEMNGNPRKKCLC
jgi:hypothetical protein